MNVCETPHPTLPGRFSVCERRERKDYAQPGLYRMRTHSALRFCLSPAEGKKASSAHPYRHHIMTTPPLASSVAPVTQVMSGRHSGRMLCAISIGCANRLSGTVAT